MSLLDGETQVPLFIISSGRSGSTFLARLVNAHPRLLCVSDLFEPVGTVPYFDQSSTIGGKAFFDILSAPSFKQRIAYWRNQPNAELLFLHDDDNMVSLLLSYTLPFVTDDPMELYHEVKKVVGHFPERTPAEQMIAFFNFLRDRFGAALWVERTGGSLPHTRQMIETWPHGKFIHNYRDPRETAISMMTGSFFRLYLELNKNPDLDRWNWDYMPPLEEMAAMLNGWFVEAERAFAGLPEDQFSTLRYEDLVANPKDTLLDFIRFVFEREPDATDLTWAETQATKIRASSLKFPRLDEREQAKLSQAVGDAMDLLGYGVPVQSK